MNPVQTMFCEKFGINAVQFRKMKRLINHAARMQEREHNEDSADVRTAAATACNAVENYAKECGFTRVQWDDGLYPRLFKDAKNDLLPID